MFGQLVVGLTYGWDAVLVAVRQPPATPAFSLAANAFANYSPAATLACRTAAFPSPASGTFNPCNPAQQQLAKPSQRASPACPSLPSSNNCCAAFVFSSSKLSGLRRRTGRTNTAGNAFPTGLLRRLWVPLACTFTARNSGPTLATLPSGVAAYSLLYSVLAFQLAAWPSAP